MGVDGFDEETTIMRKRLVAITVPTKHINMWMRQLEMKRKEICELAGLMGLETNKEIQKEKSLEIWAKRFTNHFTKKVKRLLYDEIDNMVWSGGETEMSRWCEDNKVYDVITEEEIDEIWKREGPGDEHVRLNGKYVLETAKGV